MRRKQSNFGNAQTLNLSQQSNRLVTNSDKISWDIETITLFCTWAIMADVERKINLRKTKTEKNFLKISFQDAKKMSQKKYSCLEEVEHHMNVSLSPKFIGNIRAGLKEEMDKFLFSHQIKLQGVPLAYDRIQIEQSKIIDDQEFLNLDICVKLIVFQPRVSKVLRGFVNKIGKCIFLL